MKKWRVIYYIRSKNLYTHKDIEATTADEAVKKSRVKNIEDLYIINDKGERIG